MCGGGYSADAIIEKREQTQSAIFHYVWNKVYDLELLRRENIRFDEKLRGAEDVQFNYEFVCKAKTFFLLNKRLYAYNCCNSNSITHGYHESSLNSEDAIRSIELLEGSYIETRDRYMECKATEKALYFLRRNKYKGYIRLLNKYSNYITIEEIRQRSIYREITSSISSWNKLYIIVRFGIEMMCNKVKGTMKRLF